MPLGRWPNLIFLVQMPFLTNLWLPNSLDTRSHPTECPEAFHNHHVLELPAIRWRRRLPDGLVCSSVVAQAVGAATEIQLIASPNQNSNLADPPEYVAERCRRLHNLARCRGLPIAKLYIK